MAANRDDILLERLQKTIDTWNSEVTAAQESLAQQIGDARTQLHALIGALNKRNRPNGHTNGNGEAVALRSQALAERDTALSESLERNRALEMKLRHLEENQRAPQRELTMLREELDELRGQIAAYQTQEREGAALLERAERELAGMRRQVEAASVTRQAASEEVQRLREAAEIAAREREGFEAEAERLREQLDERAAWMGTLEMEIASLNQIVCALQEQLDSARGEESSRLAELEAELAAAGRAIDEQEQRLAAGRDERARLHERLSAAETELEAIIARGREREGALQAALLEAEELRQAEAGRSDAEAALRAEVQALRATVDSLRRSGEELGADLASLNTEYERQAERLAETVRELEAHWEIERQSKERERQLQNSLSELQRLHSDAQSELSELRTQLATAQSGTVINGEPSRSEEELEGLRQELLAFEQILIEREEAVESAAARMQRLEETAVRVQAEVAHLHARQSAVAATSADTEALATVRTENAMLRGRAADLERTNEDQAERVLTLEGQVRQLRRELDAALAARPAEAAPAAEPAAAEADGAFVTSAPAMTAAAAQHFKFAAHDSRGQKKSMGEILVNAGIISSQQLDGALDEQRTAKKRRLGSILVEKGLIREEIVAQVVASQLKLPFVRLSETPVQRGAVALLDGRLATHHMAFPITASTEEVTVAMANPLDVIAIEDLEFATHLKVRPVVATLSDITSAIVEHYGVSIANAIAEDTFDVQTKQIPAQRPKA